MRRRTKNEDILSTLQGNMTTEPTQEK